MNRARIDLLGKNLKWKIDAMDFYRSKWFDLLSEDLVSGNDVIEKLLGEKR